MIGLWVFNFGTWTLVRHVDPRLGLEAARTYRLGHPGTAVALSIRRPKRKP